MLSVPNPNVPFQHVCMHCNRLHPCIQRTLLVLSFYPDLDIRSLHQIPAQQDPFSLCHLMVRMGHPTHRRYNFKKNSSGAKILNCIKKGKVGFFSGSLGWPAKGNIFCKVWIGLLLPDQSYTSRMKGSGLYFSTNTWAFTISRTIFVTKFPLQIQFLHFTGKDSNPWLLR